MTLSSIHAVSPARGMKLFCDAGVVPRITRRVRMSNAGTQQSKSSPRLAAGPVNLHPCAIQLRLENRCAAVPFEGICVNTQRL